MTRSEGLAVVCVLIGIVGVLVLVAIFMHWGVAVATLCALLIIFGMESLPW